MAAPVIHQDSYDFVDGRERRGPLAARAAAELRQFYTYLVSPQSVGSQLARNTLWSIVGSASSQGCSMLAAFLLGRLLGVTKFGQLALIQATVLLLGNLGEMGFSATTTKFVSRWRAAEPGRAGRLMGWSLRITAMSALTVAVLMIVLQSRVGIAGLAGVSREVQAGCALLIFDMLNRIQFGALAGLEAFASTARVQVLRGAITLPCVWLGTHWGDLLGAVLALGFVSLVTFTSAHIVLRSRCRSFAIPLEYLGSLERGILSTSIFMWVSGLLMYGSNWVATVSLSGRPSGLAELGLFNAAGNWKTALLFLPNMLFQVILPMLSHRHAKGDRSGCAKIIFTALGCAIATTGVAAIAVSMLSRPFMSSYGAAFTAGANVLSLAALGSIASAVYTIGAGAMWALGRPVKMLAVDLLKTSLLLGLCWAGLAGSAWNLTLAYLLSFTAGSVIIVFALYRQLRTQES